MILIPINAEPSFFTVEAELDRVIYLMTFRWNSRSLSWFFSIAALPGGRIVQGVRIVPDFPMLMQYTRPNMPPGAIIFVANRTIDRIGRTDLGTNAVLIYLSAADIASI